MPWQFLKRWFSPSRAEKAAGVVLDQTMGGLSDVAGYLKFDPVPPVLRQWMRYDLGKFRADLIAGLMVAIVTIPQAIGFAVVVGLPVQVVMVTAIVGSLVCGLFSSSRHLVFGPTNTIAIILAGALLATAGLPASPLERVLLIGLMIGVIQLASGFFKLGNLTHFISRTVIVAYGTAVGLIIAAGQLANWLGVTAVKGGVFTSVRHAVNELVHLRFNHYAAAVGVFTLLLMMLIKRLRPNWPEGLIAIAAALGLSMAYGLGEAGVLLVADIGAVSGALPVFSAEFLSPEGLKLIPALASVALAAAILGMLEAVSISKTLAARSGQKINANQELIAMGAGNLAASLFGGMAGSASFARSAVNHQSGGVTQTSGLLAGGIVLLTLLLTAQLVNHIPIAALAAYLIVIAIRLINLDQIRLSLRATRSDALVFIVTTLSALFLDLDTAVYVGIGISLALFLKKASAPSLVEYGFNPQGQLSQIDEPAERGNSAISIVHVEGELFFGAADLFQEQVRYLADDDDIRVVILRMKNARHLDATSVMSLLHLLDYLKRTGRHLLLSGINPDVERVLRRSDAWDELGEDNIFPAEANLTMATKRALLRASQLLQQDGQSGKADVRIFYDKKRQENAAGGDPAEPGDHDKPADYQI
ncbi:MAG: SulP family inorganic anion transporter [Verrucomicrobiota bacterium]